MRRATQNRLYHLLPIVFWLLAIGGSILPFTFHPAPLNYACGFIPALLALMAMVIVHRIQRHTSSIEECFLTALLLGIGSYWLPSVLFLILPIWFYLAYRNLFSFRSFLSTLIGLTLVAIWATVCIYMDWTANPWADFFATKNLWAWIPTGSILVAWLASTIAQQILRVR